VRKCNRLARPWSPRLLRGLQALCLMTALIAASAGALADPPFEPADDAQVLAYVPAGATHTSLPQRAQAAARLDVALPLAQFYIAQSRSSGDLRFLGYAQALLTPWTERASPEPQAQILMATVLQSRHEFAAALTDLDSALRARPEDAQAWLTRATVLRVLGRYPEAEQSCDRLTDTAEPVAVLCRESIRAVSGQLDAAYETTRALSPQTLTNATRAWRYSQLGEMAEALGDEQAADHWFSECLELTPDDMYTRAAYADLLLRHARPEQVLRLLTGYQSMEPLLLRVAIAQRQLHDPDLAKSRAALVEAFALEEQRGEAVHRREQARFLLEVLDQPAAALRVALINWQVQREPEDALILLRAAQAAGRPTAAAEAVRFVRTHQLQDARMTPYLPGAL
jgi:tetratricopeptide (TPR) repeat protein